MRGIRLLLGTAILVTALTTAGSWACSCASISPVAGPILAEGSFVGVPTARLDPNPGPIVSSGDPIIWTFDVDVPLKDLPSDPQEVRSARHGASCGYDFELGRRYLVNMYRGYDGEWWTSSCSGNQELPEAPMPYLS